MAGPPYLSIAAAAVRRLSAAEDRSSLDAALADLVASLAPAVTDWCLVELVDVDGPGLGSGPVMRLAALACPERVDRERARAARERHGRAELPASAARHTAATSDWPLARELRWDRWIAVPIWCGQRPAGVVTLAMSGPRPLGDDELELADCVAGAIGLALTSARAAVLREELLAVVSHDLRNALGVILLVIDYLRDDELPVALRIQFGRLERAAQWMGQTINEVVDAARLTSGALPLEIAEVEAAGAFEAACDAAQPAADEKRVTLERRLNPGLAIPADPVRLTRALELLVAGAVKRTPAGRSVTVTIARQAERVVWTVEGGAPGHPPAPPRRWVGPFAWLVAQAVALAHGGGLWLELGPGGFAVRLALPVGPERAG